MPFYSKLRKNARLGEDREKLRLRTIKGLKALRKALAAHFPKNVDRMTTVRIGTWNIREFGGNKYGGRKSYEPLYYMAEIISNFDIAALQEVRGDLDEFLELKRILGPDWDYIATDVTDGGAGNGERMVFLFNRDRVRFRHIAGELTLPDGKKVLASFGERVKLENGLTLQLPEGIDLSGVYKARSETKKNGTIQLDKDLEIALPKGSWLSLPEGCALALTKGTTVTRPANTRGKVNVEIPGDKVAGRHYRLRFPGDTLDESFKQFARTPFLVSFQANWLKIDLATVHIYYGDASDNKLLEQRRQEIVKLTEALGERAAEELDANPANKVLTALLGDFNILSKEHETMQALEANGFKVPDDIRKIPGSNVKKDKAYDQIAFWKPDHDRGYVALDVRGADVFDFFKYVYRSNQHAEYADHVKEDDFADWRTYQMSDHLPMWVEIKSDFSDAYLEDCEKPDADE